MNTINKLNLAGVMGIVADRMIPMAEDLLNAHAGNIHSIHLVGSAAISDYNERISDINSVVVLKDMDLKFVAFLAPLGKKYGKKKLAAPLVMTPEYIAQSLDVFPVEFLDFKLIHKTVYGGDLFKDLVIERPHLRLQAERDIKTRVIGVRQGFISSLGKRDALSSALVRSITGSMALFRAIIVLLDREPPVARQEVVKTFGEATGIETAIFETLLRLKAGSIKPSGHELQALFELYYHALEAIGTIIDELRV